MIAASFGGWLDTCLSRFLDAIELHPHELFGLVVVAAASAPVSAGADPDARRHLQLPGAYRFARALAVNINTMDFMTVARVRGEDASTSSVRDPAQDIMRPVLADFGLRSRLHRAVALRPVLPEARPASRPTPTGGLWCARTIGALPFAAPAVIVPSLAIASLTDQRQPADRQPAAARSGTGTHDDNHRRGQTVRSRRRPTSRRTA